MTSWSCFGEKSSGSALPVNTLDTAYSGVMVSF